MSTPLFTNLAGSTLASGISSGATSLTVASGQGALFPQPAGLLGRFFPATLQSVATPSNIEVVYCTARASDALTIVRAREGTSAQAFVTGDLVQLRPTGGTLGMLNNQFSQDAGTANAMTCVFTPVPTSYTDLIGVPMLIQKSAAANTSAAPVTINANGLGAKTLRWPNGVSVALGGELPASCMLEVVYNGTDFIITSNIQPSNLPSALCSGSYPNSGYRFIADRASPTGFRIRQQGVATFNGTKITYPIAFPNYVENISLTVMGFAGYNGNTVQIDGLSDLTGFVGYGGNPVGVVAGSILTSWAVEGY